MRNAMSLTLQRKYLSNVKALTEVVQMLRAAGHTCEVECRDELPVLLIDGKRYQMCLRKMNDEIAGARTVRLTQYL